MSVTTRKAVDRTASEMGEETGSKDFTNSLARGLEILGLFGQEHADLSITDVARETGLTAATARRGLLTLHQLGYLSHERKRFSVTPKVLNLSYAFLSSHKIWMLVQNALDDISDDLGLSCSAGVLEGPDVVFVVHAPTRSPGPVAVITGSRQKAYATAMGRVLLANRSPEEIEAYLQNVLLEKITPRTTTSRRGTRSILTQARVEGYALVDEEGTIGTCAVAVPIFDRQGRVITAINAAGRTARISAAELKERALHRLQHVASRLNGSTW